jgi:quercetin dioxygenase-like cupin family protein
LRALRSKKRWVAATVGVAVIGTVTAAALGSASSGFHPQTLATGAFTETAHVNSDRVKFQTKDATDVRVQKVVFDANSASGWHHHPGIVLVTVASGAVTTWDENCNTETYGPGLPNGAVFVESGDEPGQVTSTSGATNYVTNIAPRADPPVFRIEDDPPPCAQ